MLSDAMEKALNGQINAELFSGYMYQSMATWAMAQGLNGLAHWMNCQAKEEMIHAFKIYDFVAERNARVTLAAIDAPPVDWETPVAVAENTLAHEQKVTGLINALVDQAIEEKDHATHSFLNWFVDEQVEEEDSANDLLQKLSLAAESKGGLFMVDRELAARVFTPPVGVAVPKP